MARRIVFTDSGFWKYSWAHLVMSMTESCRWVMQCRLRAQRPRAFKQRSSALSLTHRDFSSFSKSFDVMHCRWCDLQSRCNLTFRNIVFKVFHKLLCTLHRLESLCPSLILRLCLSKTSLLYLIMLQTWCQLTELAARCSPSWICSSYRIWN